MTTWRGMRPLDRLRSYYEVAPSGCWLWQGHLNGGGYGQFFLEGTRTLAHRAAYRMLVGPIPDGHDLDHLCRVRRCVNPAHLEPVTRAENLRRGEGPTLLGRINGTKTHCPQGHPYDAANTYQDPRGWRGCRVCRRDARRRRDQRRRAA